VWNEREAMTTTSRPLDSGAADGDKGSSTTAAEIVQLTGN
jgi:hypothetical protein